MSAQRPGHCHFTQASRLGQAVEWLTEWRSAHPGEVPAAQLLTDAAAAGIATVTLHRARKQLGLRTRKGSDGWVVGDDELTRSSSRTPEAPVPVPSRSPTTPRPGTAPKPPSLPGLRSSHGATRIIAVLASSQGNEIGPREAGQVSWPPDNPAWDDSASLGDPDGQGTTVYLGICATCATSILRALGAASSPGRQRVTPPPPSLKEAAGRGPRGGHHGC